MTLRAIRRLPSVPRLLLLAAAALLAAALARPAGALPIEGSISIAPGVEPPSTKVRACVRACMSVYIRTNSPPPHPASSPQSPIPTNAHSHHRFTAHTQKVVLNGGRFATFTAADGSFLFPDVPAGA